MMKSSANLLRSLAARNMRLSQRNFATPGKPENDGEQKFNPFSVGLGKQKTPAEKTGPSAIDKVRSFFSNMTTPTTMTSTNVDGEKSVNEMYKESKKVEESNKARAADPAEDSEKRKKIIEMIDKNINRKYFSEKKLEDFFEECFSLKNAAAFLEEDKRFKSFIAHDLK